MVCPTSASLDSARNGGNAGAERAVGVAVAVPASAWTPATAPTASP